MFLLNSHLNSLAAAQLALGRSYCELTTAILPSSLTKVLSYTLGFSPYLPASVYGTDAIILSPYGDLEVFLDGLAA